MVNYLKALNNRAQLAQKRLKDSCNILFNMRKGIWDQYFQTAPSHQNAIDIFRGEWTSKFPSKALKAGEADLFNDVKVKWGIQQLGGVVGKSVLELGPFEGGHSHMLQKQGAASITAVEANPRAYMKCLIAKEVLDLNRVKFLCGDFMEYLRHSSQSFDICFASGVLYHMQNPVELLDLISRRASKVFLWTHYFDAKLCNQNTYLKPRFSAVEEANYKGFRYQNHVYTYKSRSWKVFCGGPGGTSHWLKRQAILDACKHVGFTDIQINYEELNHCHGPCFALTASKKA
ncbi:hypothetical protein PNK_0047 [Candidatus Protochlamydia naegleriophila]|uniref:Methyltransferase domain-containing protein n=1 Tax=Candidatus Protochlamydia naegleriophila TaxID=389348 RepID=A0A0U5JD29_9BACT|nr:class I SAM-dependent methyltransferase [Candidatus Protochlamydia naegleriophila]CUI15686.1 hypothetical protein PNK_0047 [Candidatus Protochlamydia naegleriophila]